MLLPSQHVQSSVFLPKCQGSVVEIQKCLGPPVAHGQVKACTLGPALETCGAYCNADGGPDAQPWGSRLVQKGLCPG